MRGILSWQYNCPTVINEPDMNLLKTSLLLLLTLLLAACSTQDAAITPIFDLDPIRTQAVSTFAAALSQTAAAVTPTASSTPRIVEPTFTPEEGTPSPAPTATSNPCYKLMYIEDVTIPDGMQMKAGEVFTKTWKVQNTGGCAWRKGFTFQHYGGDPMRGTTVTIQESVPTGAIIEISVPMVVPSGLTGLIQSAWRMADENGIFFGDTLSVNITLGDAPAATSTP